MQHKKEIDEKLVFQIFENSMKNYKKVDPNDRLEQIRERQLPKICFDDSTKPIINKVNEILSLELGGKNLSIEDVHTLTYCGAKTVVALCEKNNLPVYHQSNISKEFPKNEEEQKELYKISPQRFRRLLFNDQWRVDRSQTPSLDEITKFWSDLWKKESEYDKHSQYINNEKMRIEQLAQGTAKKEVVMTDPLITKTDLKKALKMKKNWSPSGIDGVQTFWYKKFKPVKKVLLKKINAIITQEEQMPDFFTVGFTELLPKGGFTKEPSNYRPITHLPAIYKIITRCIYQKIFDHYEKYGILADEQCGGRKNCFGVRKALVIDSVALEQESVHGYYVDFQKAFDSVPHKWILELLRIYKVGEIHVKFLEKAMSNWKTRIYLEPDIFTESIPLEKGVFQGDSTSVILYWTAVNPLSFALKNLNRGLRLEEGGILSHLLYMDDLKIYASDDEEREKIYAEVVNFSKATKMMINTEKTHKFSIHNPNERSEEVYLGYIQTPKISDNETIYHKVRKFQVKCNKLEDTKITDEDKKHFKKMFLINSIFNTFGVLHWRCFKRELLKVEVKQKFLDSVNEQRKDFEDVYLKLFNEMCKMRRRFHNEMEKSELIKNIVRNDTFTPLKLSRKNEQEYVKSLIEEVKTRKRRKRKVSDERIKNSIT